MIPGINAPFTPLAKATGSSVDEIKLIASFLLSYPFAVVLKRLPDNKPWQKNTFIVVVGLFYLVGLFDLWGGIQTILISAGATYAISYYIDGSLMPWLVFVFLMGHMSVSHIIRQKLNDPGVVDITGMQMVMVMKLSPFAWNVHDGRLKHDTLTDFQKEKAIYKLPGFLDYAAYVLFFPSLFIGPAFDYNDYKKYINTEMFEVKPNEKAPPTRKQRKIPRSGTPATYKLIEGLVWIGVYVVLAGMYYPALPLETRFWQYSFLRRVWVIYALGFASRTKYYGAWALSEGACILTGLGYNGVDPKTGKPQWDRLNNVYPWGIESAQNSRAYLENWNKNTNNWLRNYIYLRVTPKGKKPGFRATLATFTTSALWHGFYPGYYLTFVLGAFVQTAAKHYRRHLRPFFMTPDGKQPTSNKKFYDVVTWVVTQTVFSFVTAPFVILGFKDSIVTWARVYFYAIIGVGATLAFFNSPGKKYLTKRLEKRNHPHVAKEPSREQRMPTLGMLDTFEIDEAIDEIRQEVDDRRRRGSVAEFPSGDDLKKAISDRIWLKRQDSATKEGTSLPNIDLETVKEAVNATLGEVKKDK